jgi:hypothetical protein
MDKRVEELKDKLFKAVDPNHPYTYDEFVSEYGNMYDTTTVTDENTLISFKKDINFVNESDNQDPEYATNGTYGFE